MRKFALEPTSATQECAKVGSAWFGFDTLHKSVKPYRMSFSFGGWGIGLQGLAVGSRFVSRSLIGAAHCLFRQFDDSELRQHRRQVPVCIPFSDFRALETIHRGAIDRYLTVGGLHAEKRPLVSPLRSPVVHDLIAFRNGVVNSEMQIGKCLAAPFDEVPDVLGSGVQASKRPDRGIEPGL